ncbi:MAG TPA: nitroreductase family protein [Gammaproteobacteria bacterium]|nr:nitroreductase family protein [Gammaproteobacteria bacterium]
MFDKKAKTSIPINPLIASRWSGRAFDPDKSVAAEQLLRLVEAARWAPSCFGDEPWRFIICNKSTNPQAWQSALECLSEGNRAWAFNAPLLLLSVADSVLSRNNKPNRWAQYDTGAAAFSLCIQATEDGLMVHQMGGFDIDRARQEFSVPDAFTPMAMMAVGYQLPLERIEGELRDRELSERRRNPVGNNFFNGIWGNAFTTD